GRAGWSVPEAASRRCSISAAAPVLAAPSSGRSPTASSALICPPRCWRRRAPGIYERLAQGDAVAFLRDEVAAGERYDLILVADVLIYFDDLAPLARAVAQGLTDAGTFAFTVETHDGEGV